MVAELPLLEENIVETNITVPQDKEDWEADLPPNFTLIGALGTESKLLDDTLSSSHMKEWQMALDHEICQLENFRTWVIEDLPEGCTVIPTTQSSKRSTALKMKFHLTRYKQLLVDIIKSKESTTLRYSHLQPRC